MASGALTGTLLAVLGGVIHGSFALPMKGMQKRWAWENIWLVYSVVGLICLPLLLAFVTVPSLGEVYGGTSPSLLLQVARAGALAPPSLVSASAASAWRSDSRLSSG
jgi:hypothetical protein